MKLYSHLSRAELDDICDGLKMELYDYSDDGLRRAGKFAGFTLHKFRIVPLRGSDIFRKLNQQPWSGSDKRRRTFAVCWHGHYAFMRTVLELDPTAVFVTSVDRWAGLADFMRRAWASADKNIGSIMYPDLYRNACNCEAGTHSPLINKWLDKIDDNEREQSMGIVNVVNMKQSDIMKCPHLIMVPEHYRRDGSCRCDDPNHEVMATWGYVWRYDDRTRGGSWVNPAIRHVA
jgi:hypothetical protein